MRKKPTSPTEEAYWKGFDTGRAGLAHDPPFMVGVKESEPLIREWSAGWERGNKMYEEDKKRRAAQKETVSA